MEEIKNEQNTVNDVVNTTTDTQAVSKAADSNKLTMPMAIVIAGVLIALALILSGNSGSKVKNSNGKLTVQDPSALRSLNPVTEKDHIRGDLSKAKVAVVEFSDFECPYCKQLHPTMLKMMEVYPEDVAWVYRHFPLESIHPNARPAAHASECVAELAGNDGFWKFTDGIFNFAGSGSPFEPNNLASIVSAAGADITAFNTCQTSGKYDNKIDDYITDASNAGAQGTPDLTVVNLKTGEAVHIGADPNLLGQVLEQMLK